jgi:hypothetical protein
MRNTSLFWVAMAVPWTHAVKAEKVKKAEAEKANALKVAVRHASGSHGTKGA